MFRLFILICALVATVVPASDENSKYELKLGRTDNDAKWRGRLEIRRDGEEWGTVCYDRGMDDVTANVLCRFMGYKRAFPSEIMDGGNGYHLPIHVKNVRCPAAATHFQNCTYSDWGEVEGCYHFEDTQIWCTNKVDDNMYDPANCVDQHDFCRNKHQCNVDYFTSHALDCRKFCNFCGCVNINDSLCDKYKDECGAGGDWGMKMRKYYCPKTCRTCS
ncbi:hypothetical protein ACHWQZ_G009726 [Mnemiopsis leidyi]